MEKKIRMPRATTIYRDVQQMFNLTANAYGVIDSVAQLSYRPSHPVCTMPVEDIADFNLVNVRTAERAIKDAINDGLIEKVTSEKGRHEGYRALDKWWDAVTFARETMKEYRERRSREGRKSSDKMSGNSFAQADKMSPQNDKMSSGKMSDNRDNNSSDSGIHNFSPMKKGKEGNREFVLNAIDGGLVKAGLPPLSDQERFYAVMDMAIGVFDQKKLYDRRSRKEWLEAKIDAAMRASGESDGYEKAPDESGAEEDE